MGFIQLSTWNSMSVSLLVWMMIGAALCAAPAVCLKPKPSPQRGVTKYCACKSIAVQDGTVVLYLQPHFPYALAPLLFAFNFSFCDCVVRAVHTVALEHSMRDRRCSIRSEFGRTDDPPSRPFL
mmetsp:Transcript_49216/g.110696  ORF Transcript_49216/g.110696 Transcript_49216/m.110696 type:complete len:124 (+) Transcript_49216:882-1253(+)